jgi:hypothetical protein
MPVTLTQRYLIVKGLTEGLLVAGPGGMAEIRRKRLAIHPAFE